MGGPRPQVGRPQHPQVPQECRPAWSGACSPPSLPPPSATTALTGFHNCSLLQKPIKMRGRRGRGGAVMNQRGLSASPGGGAPRACGSSPLPQTLRPWALGRLGMKRRLCSGVQAAPRMLASTWGPTADGQAALGPCPTLGLDSCETLRAPRAQERPASRVSAPMGLASGQPRAQLPLRVLTCPPRTAGPPTPGAVFLTRAPKTCITHKSLPSPTARLMPISQ